MNLILLDSAECDADGRARLTDARADHIRTVLRSAVGSPVRVGLVDGPLGQATISAIDEHAVTLMCRFIEPPAPRPRIDLLLALPRPKVLRRLWAQLAAMGVDRIILTNAERVERNYFDTHLLAPETYRPLLVEGLQQARDTRLPLVSVHRRLKVLVEDELDRLSAGATRIVAHPGASLRIRDAIGQTWRTERVLLAVGPEGGWTPYELNLLATHNFAAVGIGPRTLRTDTACIALIALAGEAIAPPLTGSDVA